MRHAESLNNHLKTLHLASGHDRLRYPDPDLSLIGNQQLKHVGGGLTQKIFHLEPHQHQAISEPRKPLVIQIAVSPMRRALLTAVPIVESLNKRSPYFNLTSVEIVPFLFEKGGCYSDKDRGGFKAYPGLTSSEALEILPGASIADQAGMEHGWWKSNTRETEEELEHRIASTVAWIRRCAFDNSCDILILVTHEGFGCACIRHFLKCDRDSLDWLYNASFSCLTVLPIHATRNTTNDGDVDDSHPVSVSLNYLNCVEHLPLQTIT